MNRDSKDRERKERMQQKDSAGAKESLKVQRLELLGLDQKSPA